MCVVIMKLCVFTIAHHRVRALKYNTQAKSSISRIIVKLRFVNFTYKLYINLTSMSVQLFGLA